MNELPDGPTISAIQSVDLPELNLQSDVWADRKPQNGTRIPEAATQGFPDISGGLRRLAVETRGEKGRRESVVHGDDDRSIIVVPVAIVQPLLKLFHEAHPGIAAMQQLVARGLWWSEMMQAIVRHCAIRHACDSLKASRSLQRTPMRAFANAAPQRRRCALMLWAPYQGSSTAIGTC